ncbi:serine/threonine protein kinase [Pirellulaceae bacterium SH449]
MDYSDFLDCLEYAIRSDSSIDVVRFTTEAVPVEFRWEALAQAIEVGFQVKDYDYDWLSQQLDSLNLTAPKDWIISTIQSIHNTATQFERPFLGSRIVIPGIQLAEMELRHKSERFVLGEVFGNYRILDRIGLGGALVVYRGIQLTSGKSVSIRVPRFFSERNDAFLQNLRREFRLLQELASQNLPGVQRQMEWFEHEHVPISVCEFVEGSTLTSINARLNDPRKILEIVEQTAEVVGRVHEYGHIHGDIKPDNLILSDRGILTLIDFNVSLPLDPTIDRSPPYSGTLSAMGLDSIAGSEAEIDVRRDVYAIGALLYELVEKKPLIQENTREDAFVALALLPLKKDSLFSQGTSPAIRSIVEIAIARDVNNRFENCFDLANACRKAISHLNGEIKPKRNQVFLLFRIGRSMGEISRRVEILLPLSEKIAVQETVRGIDRMHQFEILGFSSISEERRNILLLSEQASVTILDPDASDFFGAVVIRISRATKKFLDDVVERLKQLQVWLTDTKRHLREFLEGQPIYCGVWELGFLVGRDRETVTFSSSFRQLMDECELGELCTLTKHSLTDQRIPDISARMQYCEGQVRVWLENAVR